MFWNVQRRQLTIKNSDEPEFLSVLWRETAQSLRSGQRAQLYSDGNGKIGRRILLHEKRRENESSGRKLENRWNSWDFLLLAGRKNANFSFGAPSLGALR